MSKNETRTRMSPAEYGACKRAWEHYGADPAWRAKFLANPVEALAAFPAISVGAKPAHPTPAPTLGHPWPSNVYAAFKAIGMVNLKIAGDRANPYYDEYLRRYEEIGAFLDAGFREERFADARLFRWNAIALRRARLENSGIRNRPHIRFYPLMFELSDGCREQCPFCGLAAPPHRGDFRATPENRRLWREVLATSREIVGDIADQSACYFATEPLDNPDYETLLADFAAVLGLYPQTTTALAAREPRRVRALMDQLGAGRMHLAALRFSVRSLDEFRRLMAEYTAEELADVELLLNNPESGSVYSASGRARIGASMRVGAASADWDAPSGGASALGHPWPSVGAKTARPAPAPTLAHPCASGKLHLRYSISCVAGFRVNMARHSVAFMEPMLPDDDYPTGVRVYAEENFADAEEYAGLLRDFINRFARDTLPDDAPIALNPAVKAEETERFVIFHGDGQTMRLGGNIHFRGAVRRLQAGAATLPDMFRSLGIGDFLSTPVRQKLNLLYSKGFLIIR